MSSLRAFEIEAVRLLAGQRIDPALLEDVIASAELSHFEETDSGYFVTLSHPDLPRPRIVASEPTVLGRSGEIVCGFVLYVEDASLTLECHSWGPTDLPSGSGSTMSRSTLRTSRSLQLTLSAPRALRGSRSSGREADRASGNRPKPVP